MAFHHPHMKHLLEDQVVKTIKAYLNINGMAMKQGTILDATLNAAPSSTKNKTVHAGADSESGLIHLLETTSTNVQDLIWQPSCCTVRT